MSCRCAPALVVLRTQIDARWPRRDKSSDGCCGDSAHAARKSDHNPVGGFAHALDIDADLSPSVRVDVLLADLLADPRCKYVIRNGRIRYPDGTNNKYTGVNAHTKHLHLSIKPGATFDLREWRLPGVTPQPAPEDDVSPEQDQRLKNIENGIKGQNDDAWPRLLTTLDRIEKLLKEKLK